MRNPDRITTSEHHSEQPSVTPAEQPSIPPAEHAVEQRAARTSSLLGMPLDAVDLDAALTLIGGWTSSTRSHFVVTPNTDHFLRWQRDPSFRSLYEGADLVTTDGAPLSFLARLEGLDVHRVTGVDLFSGSVARAAQQGTPLIIIGGLPGVAARAASELQRTHPALDVPLVVSPTSEELRSETWLAEMAQTLRAYPDKLVALCLGSPKQEKMFYDLRRIDPQLAGAFLCVGAAVDFAAGTLRRAPRIFQSLGIEWMFRLLMEPRRLWRRYLVDDVQIFHFLWRSALRRATRRRGPGPARPEAARAASVRPEDAA